MKILKRATKCDIDLSKTTVFFGKCFWLMSSLLLCLFVCDSIWVMESEFHYIFEMMKVNQGRPLLDHLLFTTSIFLDSVIVDIQELTESKKKAYSSRLIM
jgi:hypothetical protein